jgi:hypothetical protein
MKAVYMILSLMMVLAAANYAEAIPTQITVHVKSKDAKFIGGHMGGAVVTIRDVGSGRILAEGVASGDTGNTDRIMSLPIARGTVLSDEKSAKYTAVINIDEPTLVEVTAKGPLALPKSANQASVTQWVVPGKHIATGDAWLIELPGFAVDIQAPSADTTLKGAPQDVTIKARVMMMCGCPITPGGIWDANKIEVSALLYKNGKRTGLLTMQYAGTASQFLGTWKIKEPGAYKAIVYSYDPANGNTGVDSVTFTVEK